MVVDGYSGFIMLDKNEKPKVALHIENECRWSLKKYAKLHLDEPLPHITPHVLRHTFCTDIVQICILWDRPEEFTIFYGTCRG